MSRHVREGGERKLYLYHGLLVQVVDDVLSPVRLYGEVVPARHAPSGTAPLPAKLRRQAQTLMSKQRAAQEEAERELAEEDDAA